MQTVVALFPHPVNAHCARCSLERHGVVGVRVMGSDERGQVINVLTRCGVPVGDAHVSAEGARRGSALVIVTVEDGRAAQARAVLDRYNAIDIDRLGSRYRADGQVEFDATRPTFAEIDFFAERGLNKQITAPPVEDRLFAGTGEVPRCGARTYSLCPRSCPSL